MAPMKKQHLETDVDNVHSLPNIEEARTQNIMATGGNKYSGKKKRTIALVVILVAVITAAIGFTIAATQNKRGENESNALTNNASDDEDTSNDDASDDNDDNETDDTERIDQVKEFLSTSGISSQSSLDDSNLPQHKAAVWIANTDEREFDIPESMDEDDAYEFIQRYVMAVVYYALDGANWARSANFLSGERTCDWNFELSLKIPVPGTDQEDFDYGVSCWDDDADEYGDTVTYIFMPDNNLVGSLPSEIGFLNDLNHMSLFSNKIVGVIPDSFKNLQNLEYLAMESNQLGGPLPSWINELESLEYLALGNNTFSGPLPSFDGSALLQLSLDNNQLTGSIDGLNDATFLTVAYLNNNRLTGKISENTWVDLDDISIADLSTNLLTGSFPVSFYWFEEIDLSNNQLTGKIAEPEVDEDDDDVNEYPITKINLSDNDIEGPIPSGIDKLSLLVSFDVTGNALTGSIPTQLGNLPKLESLYLSDNENFEAGAIPDLRRCQVLTELSLASTNRNSNIHEWIGSTLTDLKLLDLHSNSLTGGIPTTLASLDNIEVLMLNRNNLDGNVPSELGDLENLEILFLDHNAGLTGDMEPICDGNSEDLEFLTVDVAVINCDRECCSEYCTAADDDCNRPNGTVTKFDYNFISRETFIYGEDFKLAEVPSPEN